MYDTMRKKERKKEGWTRGEVGKGREKVRKEITLKESNRVRNTIKEREIERVEVVRATKTKGIESEGEIRTDAVTLRDRIPLLFFPAFVPQLLLRFSLVIEEKRRSEILPLYLGFQAITRLPRDLITFLSEAGLSSLIKMIGP